ncbi:UDP-glucosyltransferase 2-like [Melitaea cinxia]|uniref:UDP-glucosyltransferase 2-like n=1 Tax=Melitaea cinxia TaxID=113334 RepID=UPI001E2726A5|nr:UDP-glucosyltransferase 2-like [Melitaea cinxia]
MTPVGKPIELELDLMSKQLILNEPQISPLRVYTLERPLITKTMLQWTILIVYIISSMFVTHAYKILVVSPIPGKSHAILGQALVNHLAQAGHEVTYIVSLVPDKAPPGVTIINLSENKKQDETPLNIKSVMDNEFNSNFVSFLPLLMNISQTTVENPKVQKLMSDKNQHFDLVIAEWMFNEVYVGFSAVFNCPLIWLSSVEPHWMVLQLIDEIPNPAYNVDIMSRNAPPLSFAQRVWELCVLILGKLIQVFYTSGFEKEIYENLFVPHIRNRGHNVVPFDVVRNNASLILSNSHISMGIATRLPPNFIPIGGYHIDPVIKTLPENILKIMDNSKYGVIYFSMGTNLKSAHFPNEVKQALLKVFSELKQTVLWKFEENIPNLPRNVHILEWAPQQSILEHKNCILFITHGGLLSTTEAIHFKVPIIGIPVFADQFINIDRAVKKGFAKKVELTYSMADHLNITIQEMLSDQRYADKVRELSGIYHDRTVSPSKELVHWVEHVIKTGGARHLRTPAFLMPWYQKMFLDLVLYLLATIISIKYTFRYICSLVTSKNSISGKKKRN